MFDVNIDAVIATLSGTQEIENLRPFLIPEKAIVTFNLRADHRGYLELQTVSGSPVFLYKGSNLTAAQIEELLKGENPNFDCAAAIGQAARIQMEASIGEITLFAEKPSVGFIRHCQYPYPPFSTQAKLA